MCSGYGVLLALHFVPHFVVDHCIKWGSNPNNVTHQNHFPQAKRPTLQPRRWLLNTKTMGTMPPLINMRWITMPLENTMPPDRYAP